MKACEQCGAAVGVQGTRFCSTVCWYAYTKARRTQPCEVCGTAFEKVPKTKKTCSKACADQLRRADRKVICKTCGVDFERPHGKHRDFCSRSCAMQFRVRSGQFIKPEGTVSRHANGYLIEKRGTVWILQHRLIMEEKIGRKLADDEHVHHMNGIRDDNRPENLELWTGRKDPPGVRTIDHIRELLKTLTPEQRTKLLEE